MNVGDRIFSAFLDEMHVITVLLPYTYHHGVSNQFFITDGINLKHSLNIKEKIKLEEAVKYICTMDIDPQFELQSWILDEHGGKTDLQIGAVIRTAQFDQQFFYEGTDLGVNYTANKVVFKLWAPTASDVDVKLQAPEDHGYKRYSMSRQAKGVWILALTGEYEHYLYSFLVCVNREWDEAVDPYAVAVTANGKMGVIVDLEKTKIEKLYLPSLESPVDAIIYETHIRDFTIHPKSGVEKKGTYLGAAEIGTFGKDGKPTCLSYVKNLGVSHVEFLPFHDYEGVDELGNKKDYNWGYNPIHFNVPDGSYASNPNDPYSRINELKKLIHSVQKQGLRVIMDVVYNHVYKREDSSFEKIVPGYYFRHDQFGMPSNGTGVGNDIASERLMVRKFIIDSVLFWMKEYHIDGFRFDLMGIFDLETMNEVRRVVDNLNQSALIIGEGWDLNTPIPADQKASIRNQKKLPRIAQFNDWFRDSIKGSTFNLYDRGFALGNDHYYDTAKQLLAGSIGIEKASQGIFLEPVQTVNYVECHDNHTLWDKLAVCCEEREDIIKQKMHRMATGMVLLAQGIPFLHSGQEFFRTKKGNGNTYRAPDDINWLDWERKDLFSENVRYVKGLIDIRKSHRAFRLPTAMLIRKHVEFLRLPKPIIGYYLKEVGSFGKWNSIVVLVNPTLHEYKINLPLEGTWSTLAHSNLAAVTPIMETSHENFSLEAIGLSILVK